MLRNVERLMPLRFASGITFTRLPSVKQSDNSNTQDEPPAGGSNDEEDSQSETEPTTDGSTTSDTTESVSPAPVAMLAADHGSLLIACPHGKGRIVLLSEPYVIANNG